MNKTGERAKARHFEHAGSGASLKCTALSASSRCAGACTSSTNTTRAALTLNEQQQRVSSTDRHACPPRLRHG